MYVAFIAGAFLVGLAGGFFAVLERACRREQNTLGQSRPEPSWLDDDLFCRPPLPRRDTDWQRLVDLQNRARAEIDGMSSPIYDATAVLSAARILGAGA